MKILLIYPPANNMITTNVPTIVEGEKGFYPPLGLMYVAAYAEKYTDHEIEILDTQVENLSYAEIETRIRKIKPDVVGIQTMTFTLIDALTTAEIVKNIDETIHVNLGGPHVGIYPLETIKRKEVDSLVLGEGEITFTQLINNIDDKEKLRGIKGLVFKDKGEIINTGQSDFIDNLDDIPFPARHLTHYNKYYSLLAKRSPVTTMFTSRGCPYNCLFCDRPSMGKKFRARSAENVVHEFEECFNMGIKEIFIYDDTFTIDRQRVIDICDKILERNLDIGWDIRARVNTVDEELLRKLKAAGCERIHYGVEAGTPEILKVLRKGITLEQAQKAFKMTRDIGIDSLAYFMIGSPGETREQIMQTMKFAGNLNPDYVHFSITTPFPATDLYKQGLNTRIFADDYWSDFAANPTKDFIPQLWEGELNREELVVLLKKAYKNFYLRPNYIMKKLVAVKSIGELKRKAKAGIKVFKI